MSNDKTLADAVRYEWFSASEQWKACDHSEAQKLPAAGYGVREVRSFRMDCTCPSGDGSLRHPCLSHPATLATATHGGCVQLPTSERERFEAWARGECLSLHRYDSGPYSHDRTFSAWLAWQAALAARQPVGEPVDDDAASEAFGEFADDYLTDGNGYAPASTYAACSKAFTAAWPDRVAATAAARAELRRLHGDDRTVGARRAEALNRADARNDAEDDAAPPAQAVDLGAEPMFYIQDTRQFVGNCPMWWGPNGRGYVTRLDEAGRYTEQEAIKQNRTRDTDIPWPCAEIDAIARHTVDLQHMRPRAERLAELALIGSQAVGNG